jgi:ankyrin repeat protein
MVTPLNYAAIIGSVPKALVLLAVGADINTQSHIGMSWTALYFAATL